jgi:hypothetical protein
MIAISGTVSKAYLAKALGATFNRAYYMDSQQRYAVDSQCHEYIASHFPDMRLFYSESNLGQIDYWDQNQILVGGIQPNLILGMFLGADFIPQDNFDADITPGCFLGKNPVDFPSPETLLDHPLMKQFVEQIEEIQSDSQGKRRPIPPFFWDQSGRATIHGALTTAQKFYNENFFVDLMTDYQKSLEIMHWIAEAYIVLSLHFSSIADLPITDVHVGECSSCMVSPDLVEQFVVPVTSKIGRELGPVRFHSCGPSTSHLSTFAKIDNLISLDLGGDTSIQKAREIFGAVMQISVSPLPADMSANTPGEILAWAKRILDENNGGNLEFLYHLEPSYNLDTILALIDFINGLS